MNEQRLLEFIGEIISSSCSKNEAVYSLRELETILEAQNAEPALIQLAVSAIDGLKYDYSTMRSSISGTSARVMNPSSTRYSVLPKSLASSSGI